MARLKYLSCLFVCVVFAILLSSCQKNDKTIAERLSMLEQVVDQDPDSVLSILDSVYPYDLNEEDYNKFLLLQIQAKDKAYKNIVSDSVVFQVKKYFLSKKDFNNLALATYYCGRVLQEQNMYNEAVAFYLDAEKFATQISNYNLAGLSNSSIGGLLSIQFNQDEAILKFKEGISAFRRARNKENEIMRISS